MNMTENIVDPAGFRRVLGHFTTGIAVVTTLDKDKKPKGITVNSFSSLSLEPPLILWSIGKSASTFDIFNEADYHAIHILKHDQQELSDIFALRGGDGFDDMPIKLGLGGIPLFDQFHARLECETINRYEGGDHIIIVSRAHRISEGTGNPLIYYRGDYKKSTSKE